MLLGKPLQLVGVENRTQRVLPGLLGAIELRAQLAGLGLDFFEPGAVCARFGLGPGMALRLQPGANADALLQQGLARLLKRLELAGLKTQLLGQGVLVPVQAFLGMALAQAITLGPGLLHRLWPDVCIGRALVLSARVGRGLGRGRARRWCCSVG